jgi:hypothetical protein
VKLVKLGHLRQFARGLKEGREGLVITALARALFLASILQLDD